MAHIPVLLQECLTLLNPKPGETFADGTLGAAGHAREVIARIAPNGVFIGVDRDPRAILAAEENLAHNASVTIHLVPSSYAQIPEFMHAHGIAKLDGLLLDLGFSSEQIIGGTLSGRGFSFMTDEPLLMTYDDETPSLAMRLSELTTEMIEEILREYGEERYASQIAKSIEQRARIKGIATTRQLVEAITAAVPQRYEGGRIHPATRTFQAFRIFVNDELGQLKKIIAALPEIMREGGRVAIISFHSLEDRIVKQSFVELARNSGGRSARYGVRLHTPGEAPNSTAASSSRAVELLTKKPVTAGVTELAANPRSRSAKLRALRFL